MLFILHKQAKVISLCFLIFACKEPVIRSISQSNAVEKSINNIAALKQIDSCFLEKLLVSKGFVNIHSLDTSIQVSLHYSTNQNFLHKPIYQGLHHCYLPCDVAIKLCNAQCFLKQQFPYYNLIVFDATRPLSAQTQMWNELDMPAKYKINYLAHPHDISLHNYGAAVDVGIISNDFVLLDMGTSFDSFDELSQPKNETQFYKQGKLSKSALSNRLLLRSVMLTSGFTSITSEWWHFNATNKHMAAIKYKLIQ